MEKTDTKDEKQHREIVTALQKVTSEINMLRNEVTTLRHAVNEAAKRKWPRACCARPVQPPSRTFAGRAKRDASRTWSEDRHVPISSPGSSTRYTRSTGDRRIHWRAVAGALSLIAVDPLALTPLVS